jgi:hypothetical protein
LLKYAAATLLAALHIINVDETDWAHRSQFGGPVYRQRGALGNPASQPTSLYPLQKAASSNRFMVILPGD